MERTRQLAARIACGYPLLLPLLVYGHWLLAWAELGRMPVALLDDPKHIGTLTPGVHWLSCLVTVVGLYAYLLALALLVLAALWPRQQVRKATWLTLAASVLGGAGTYWLMRSDPGDVVVWFLD
jgi:hypothetical protein